MILSLFRLLFQFFIRNFACEFKKKRFMTTYALNNLWTYIEGLSLKQKDRKWLANKLLEPVEVDAETKRQQEFVKESLTRALDEVKRAKRGEAKMMTLEEFEEKLRDESIL